MPLYEYYCEHCESTFTELKKMSEAGNPADCPACAEQARRVFLSAPRLNTMPAARRKAFQTNERSSHEPRMSRGHVCGSNCHHHKKSTTETEKPAFKKQDGKRPWMLGH